MAPVPSPASRGSNPPFKMPLIFPCVDPWNSSTSFKFTPDSEQRQISSTDRRTERVLPIQVLMSRKAEQLWPALSSSSSSRRCMYRFRNVLRAQLAWGALHWQPGIGTDTASWSAWPVFNPVNLVYFDAGDGAPPGGISCMTMFHQRSGKQPLHLKPSAHRQAHATHVQCPFPMLCS